MKEFRKFYTVMGWMFSRSWSQIILAVFNVTTASLFAVIFISMGNNIYETLVKQYNIDTKYEQLDVYIKGNELFTSDMGILYESAEEYRQYYRTEKLEVNNEFSIGVYEVSNTLFFGVSNEKAFLYCDEERLLQGAIITNEYRQKLGFELNDIDTKVIKISKGNDILEVPIVAVLNPEAEDVLNTYYVHDVYLNRKILNMELPLQLVSVQIENEKKYLEQIESTDVFVFNATTVRNQYISIAKTIRTIVNVFGIAFSYLGGMGLIDAVRNLINHNRNKFYLMLAMGFDKKVIKMFLFYTGGIIGIIGAVFGMGVSALFFECLQLLYRSKMIFNISMEEILVLNSKMIIPCVILVELVTLSYVSISSKKISNEMLLDELNGME